MARDWRPDHIAWANEMKRDFSDLLEGISLDEIVDKYPDWSEDNWCAGWMMPNKGIIKNFVRDIKFKGEVKND